MGNGQRRWVPPGMGGSPFRGRAGLVIEVAPRQFMRYVLRGVTGDMEITTDYEDVRHGEYLAPIRSVPISRLVVVNLQGHLSGMEEEADRPTWVTDVAGELEARRALEGRS